MIKESNKRLMLVFAIFAFSFLYRFFLMTRATYPSGADIGLHNSVIHSITQGGNVDFLYNYYQMGGGLSLTFPGYHIFAAQIMMLTGMPEYLVHAVIVSLVSSVIVLAAFLITRSVWRESAAFIVAFLVAISRFDIEMLLWGGYPNVITLLLIPVTFYMYIEKKRFTKIPFYLSTSLLIASIFLTHSLSSIIFVSILFTVILAGLIFRQKIGTAWREISSWLIPVILGAIIVSPFLIKVVPAYLSNTTPAAINEATASTRILPYEIVVPLFVIVGLFFLLSKKYQKHYFTIPTLMMVFWLLIPLIFSQSYLVKMYTDYNRYLYFVIMPVCFLVGLFIDLGSGFFARVIDTYRTLTSQLNTGAKEIKLVTHKRLAKIESKISHGITRKNIYCGFVVGLLIVFFAFVPIFMPLSKGIEIQTFYQRMNPSLMEAMDWARTNTPQNATFVTEAYYGWWFGGFAQRPTWSAVSPQYLMLGRELPVAQNATYLLDTDYMFETNFTLSDNQYASLQVREDGGYLARHNPEILTKLNWTYFPYSFFNLNSANAEIAYSVNGQPIEYVYLNELIVKDMHMENDSQHVTVSITRGNQYFDCVQTTTVNQGSKFVNLTTKLYNTTDNVTFSELTTHLEASAKPIGSKNNTIGFLAESVKAFGQIIFNKNIPGFNRNFPGYTEKLGTTDVELTYSLDDVSQAEIEMSATTYSVTDKQDLYSNAAAKDAFFSKQIDSNLQPETRSSLPLPEPFNYASELKTNGLDYVVIPSYYEKDCKADMKLKFANDPLFSLVFINNEVAIFEVKK
jgi:hypothetical protein